MKKLNTVQNELTNLGFTVYINRNDELVLTSEKGNLDAFEYVNFDYPVGLIPALHSVAKKAGYEWQCEYCGTYKLYPL